MSESSIVLEQYAFYTTIFLDMSETPIVLEQ